MMGNNQCFYVETRKIIFDILLNIPLYTGRLFHCYMLDEANCQVYLVPFILFLMENTVSKHCRPRSDATLCGI